MTKKVRGGTNFCEFTNNVKNFKNPVERSAGASGRNPPACAAPGAVRPAGPTPGAVRPAGPAFGAGL